MAGRGRRGAPSTNGYVADRFRTGEGEGLVVAAEHQTAGRGRLGREWVTPARTSLTVSFLLVPDGPSAERWPWLPLLTGVAAAAAVRRVTGVQVSLKWPNDVLADDHKLGGILLERVERDGSAAAVVGVGINCSPEPRGAARPEATSLAIVTGGPGRPVGAADGAGRGARGALRRVVARVPTCARRTSSCAPRPASRSRSPCPGARWSVRRWTSTRSGRLVVRTASGEEHLGAGDVVHVRPE